MTKSPRKNVPDVGIELGAACMPSELASDRETAPGRNEEGKLVTDLHTKPTDKYLYVTCKSSHPGNVKKAIPYSLGMRIKRICTKEDDYRRLRGELKHQLRKRGYCGKFIEGQLQRVYNLSREKILEKMEKKKMECVLLVPNMRQLPNVHGIVRQHLDTLYEQNERGISRGAYRGLQTRP